MKKAKMGPYVPRAVVGTTESGVTYIASTELTMEDLTKARDSLVRALAKRKAGERPYSKSPKKKG